MEWAWLLREWQRLSGNNVDSRVQRLTAHATAFGIDFERGIVQGNVLESGEVIPSASRVWQQTEAIRTLCCEDSIGTQWPGSVSMLTDSLFRYFLRSDLNGGWIDQIDKSGKPTVDYMPASRLYHLVGAAIDGGSMCADYKEKVARSV
jgi:mannose/cellobiose epimerase-like protein (N-acyl-D-glucosamine 2-epimerase family)